MFSDTNSSKCYKKLQASESKFGKQIKSAFLTFKICIFIYYMNSNFIMIQNLYYG